MKTPELRTFLGWDKPAIELVAERLYSLLTSPDKQVANLYRRATLVVPTSGSGRRLREYMAEAAGHPLLMPTITLAGKLIPTEGYNTATEEETITAWIQAMREREYPCLLPNKEIFESESWLLDTIFKLRSMRARLEKENCPPKDVAKKLLNRSSASKQKSTQQVLTEESNKWAEMATLFSEVDEIIKRYQLIPREEARAAAIKTPTCQGNRSLLILACVPEISRQLEDYVTQLNSTGCKVEIWINAPEEEKDNFDAVGRPIPEHWGKRSIDIPNALVRNTDGKISNEDSTIHLTDDGDDAAIECVRLVHEVMEGKDSDNFYLNREVVISCCDSTFTPRLHAAFRMAGGDSWILNLPEGRSLLTMDAAHIFRHLIDACKESTNFPLYDETNRKILHNNMLRAETFCTLLKNKALMHILPSPAERATVSNGFLSHLEALIQNFLPGTASRLLHLLNPQNNLPITTKESTAQYETLSERHSAYYNYALSVAQLVQTCGEAPLSSALLQRLHKGIMSLPQAENMQAAFKKLCQPIKDLLDAKNRGLSLLDHPILALEYIQLQQEKQAAGALPLTNKEQTESDIPGWKELSFYHGCRLIINGMHDGCIPEPPSAEELLPESLCADLQIQHSIHREARDAYLLTALLQSRTPGEVHFVLARQSADGTPLSASSLLLRCGDCDEGQQQLAERANYLFAESSRVKLPPEPETCPLRTINTSNEEKIHPGEMESLSIILQEGEYNPFAPSSEQRSTRTFSPSSLSVFLECPLTFWIKNALKIDPSSHHIENKMEPESNEYGTGIHSVLDKLVEIYPSLSVLQSKHPDAYSEKDYIYHVSKQAEELADSLLSTAYSENGFFTLPMQARHLIMKRTLKDFARHHVEELLEGWCNVARELKVTPVMTFESEGSPEPAKFNMTIDRVDYNINTHTWRVLDYKTSSEPKEPRKVHYEEVPEAERSVFHRFMNATDNSAFPLLKASSKSSTRHYRWRNIQLPLYSYALLQMTTAELISLLREQEQTPSPEVQELLTRKPQEELLLNNKLPEMAYCSLSTKTQEVSYNSLMNAEEIKAPRQHFYFVSEPIAHYQSAICTIRSAVQLIRSGLCLFSAVSLELKKKPYAQYGGLTPSADPREMFALPSLDK